MPTPPPRLPVRSPGIGELADRPLARQTAAWKLLLTVTRAEIPRDRTRWSRLRTSISGGPNRPSVPAMSMTQRKAASSLRSSTRGENPPAHSSRMALAAISSFWERHSTTGSGKGIDLNSRHAMRHAEEPRLRVESADLLQRRLPLHHHTWLAVQLWPETQRAPALETPLHRDRRRVLQAWSSRTCPCSSALPAGIRRSLRRFAQGDDVGRRGLESFSRDFNAILNSCEHGLLFVQCVAGL